MSVIRWPVPTFGATITGPTGPVLPTTPPGTPPSTPPSTPSSSSSSSGGGVSLGWTIWLGSGWTISCLGLTIVFFFLGGGGGGGGGGVAVKNVTVTDGGDSSSTFQNE